VRIAQLAPLIEPVPPVLYGGTERVVAALTEALVDRGHQVTLFASGDSQTRAELVPVVPRALRLAGVTDALPAALLAARLALERADEFDVIHSHLDLVTVPFGRCFPAPVVHTLHGRLDLPEIQPLFAHCTDAHLVAISENQRRLLPDWGWLGTVYNGIDVERYTFHPRSGGYLAFLGRMSPDKGIEDAIAVARLAGLPLRIAAKVDPTEQAYFDGTVRPLLDEPGIEYVGEVPEEQKAAFLGQALALVFPIGWPEPFGLVMAEAMASGTPVIAARYGAVPEVLVDGETGIICDSIQEMALACGRVATLDRVACRARVASTFSHQQMAAGYEAVYQQLLTRD
jgi:glycosyltransferase involved in cell wall biosynthesis